jgi:hypothetical protein
VSDPAVHQASYEFADRAALDRAMSGGEALKTLVADFNRDWPRCHAHARGLLPWRRSLRQGDSCLDARRSAIRRSLTIRGALRRSPSSDRAFARTRWD